VAALCVMVPLQASAWWFVGGTYTPGVKSVSTDQRGDIHAEYTDGSSVDTKTVGDTTYVERHSMFENWGKKEREEQRAREWEAAAENTRKARAAEEAEQAEAAVKTEANRKAVAAKAEAERKAAAEWAIFEGFVTHDKDSKKQWDNAQKEYYEYLSVQKDWIARGKWSVVNWHGYTGDELQKLNADANEKQKTFNNVKQEILKRALFADQIEQENQRQVEHGRIVAVQKKYDDERDERDKRIRQEEQEKELQKEQDAQKEMAQQQAKTRAYERANEAKSNRVRRQKEIAKLNSELSRLADDNVKTSKELNKVVNNVYASKVALAARIAAKNPPTNADSQRRMFQIQEKQMEVMREKMRVNRARREEIGREIAAL